MTEQVRLEVNCATGEEKYIPLTEEEIAQRKVLEEAWAKIETERKAEAQAKAEAKTSALAKLAALGLTEEEAAAIAG